MSNDEPDDILGTKAPTISACSTSQAYVMSVLRAGALVRRARTRSVTETVQRVAETIGISSTL